MNQIVMFLVYRNGHLNGFETITISYEYFAHRSLINNYYITLNTIVPTFAKQLTRTIYIIVPIAIYGDQLWSQVIAKLQ